MTTVLRVAVPSPLREPLDYLPPGRPEPPPLPGSRVLVPLGRRRVVGVVTAHADDSALAPERLRAVERVLDTTPILPPDLLRLALWAADYYQHPPGEVLAQFLPAASRRVERRPPRRAPDAWRLTAAGRALGADALSGTPARRRAVGLLAAAEAPSSTEALADLGVRRPILRQLEVQGLVERVESEPKAEAPADLPAASTAGPTAPPSLTAEQAGAAEAIAGADDRFRAFLLDGITGSGKTEVYFRAMRRVLDAGRQVLLLVPEIGLTPQTLQRLHGRFGEPVAVLHSGLGETARLRAWHAAADGRARIVVGTRSAALAPLRCPGLIVVDEEHDPSYKQQEGFRYSARDLAVKRARDLDVPIVLGSATPSLETLNNALGGRYEHLVLGQRAAGSAPAVELLDLRHLEVEEGLSRPLIDAARARLEAGQQVLLFLNRRGFAPVLMCHSCSWIAECPRCDARFTLHTRPTALHCHHCGRAAPLPALCPSCGNPEPMPVGLGTQRTEAALVRLFPDVPVIRIDRDAARSQQALQARFDRVLAGGPALLVGTQMLAKGHHFPDVTLAAVLDADAGLFSADFRGPERLAQQLVQVAGRAGRAEAPGKVLIQTHQPDHPLLTALVEHGYAAFARAALEERRAAGLPPFAHLALLRAEAGDREGAAHFLEAAAAVLQRYADEVVEVLGPVPATMERRAGRFRAQLLLQSARRSPLHQLLRATLPSIDTLREARRVRWSLDVDPVDTL